MPPAHVLLLAAILVAAAGCSGDVASTHPSQTTDKGSSAVLPSDDIPAGSSSDPEASIEMDDETPVDGDLSDETPTAKSPDTLTSTASAPAAASTPMSGVDLVYFHTAEACGCMAEMGDVIVAALYEHFPQAVDDKAVRFHSIVSDDPANAYYVRMYGSQAFDLFLVTYEGGNARATQVYEIWSLLGDNEAVALAVKSRVADGLARSAQPV